MMRNLNENFEIISSVHPMAGQEYSTITYLEFSHAECYNKKIKEC